MTSNTVTKEHLDNLVAKSDVEYAVFGNKLTIAVITLPNKFKVTGEASCVDANNFDKALGEKYALEAATKKLWELEGYLLATELQRQAEWDATPRVGSGKIPSENN
ncbi:Gp49 family protein [Psychrobacter sp. BF1]|uniref:Gp49 family protein n=1 Tax=Psychrobacter sp. BF1 TaxID=2821147 RepID=UPI001C4DF299|nr:Gp49 family protein [Psychrobacter sp. BF1]